MPANISIEVSAALYLRDPEATPLGRKIVSRSIILIDQLGMEKFTFKKLAADIDSTEASVYRYFKSKRHLLNYLFAWYWGWLEYRLLFRTNNIEDPKTRLRAAVEVLAESIQDDPLSTHIDESILHRIVVTESDRTLLTHHLRQGEEHGIENYKLLCNSLSTMIQAVNPEFKFPQALTITLLAATHRQRFYAEYFPSVTEVSLEPEDSAHLAEFLEQLAFSVLE